MAEYKVVEKFVSINGEGKRAGELAVFIRFFGCNLTCSYCDTAWANEKDTPFTIESEQGIYQYVKNTGVKNITLTGGEPLLQDNIKELLTLLCADTSLRVEIETNGSVDLSPFLDIPNPPVFTMDYKLPDSDMEAFMCHNNFQLLTQKDTVKFVSGSRGDLIRAKQIMEQYQLIGKCTLYLSPVFGKIEPKDMVAFLIEEQLNDVKIQLQLHKFIWHPDERGV